jgi:hypothetical protein
MCPIYISPTWVFWTFLMTYCTEKLKSSGVIASPCFRPFWIENLSDKCLPTQTLLYVSFKHILMSLTSFMGTPNPMRNNALCIVNAVTVFYFWVLHPVACIIKAIRSTVPSNNFLRCLFMYTKTKMGDIYIYRKRNKNYH